MEYLIEGPLQGQAHVCEPILRSLLDWFGIEEALLGYVRDIDQLPTFLARSQQDVIGFVSLKQHNRFAAEIYVMGVCRSAHRQGVGRGLMNAAEAWLSAQRVEYLQVKTLGPSHPDPNYAFTRAFYLEMGFKPLEEFNQIWDAHNPCLILIKKLEKIRNNDSYIPSSR